ncbi:MAG TPA: flavoprotein [Victivallales bacterium]|nr:flavoprotein [Victivallales bacterium]
MDKIKNIVLGVTGSIAAYKAADLVSKLSKENYNVTVIMTQSALNLIGERTFFTLSKNKVVTSLWELPEWQPGHVELALKAKLLLIAPATANIIGKIANGIADDALSTFALSHSGKIIMAPAMNVRMWNNEAVKENCKKLASRGVIFIGPEKGRLACGEDGEGRMSEPEKILTLIKKMI